VMYVSHATTAPRGRILRNIAGGHSDDWELQGPAGAIPDNDRVTALVACKHDVNLIFGGGLAGDAADGYLLVGKD
jgi:hypothetical protein